jgi:tetratricopeptide (TPR) repeat protein
VSEELALQEQLRGKSDPRVAKALNHVATANLALGRTDEANAHHERALAILATAYGEQHPDYAVVLNDLANGFVQMGKLEALGRHQDARGVLDPAVQILCGDPTVRCAEAQFALAQALWELRLDRTRARELAAAAQAKLASSDAAMADEIAAWRAKH